MEDVDSKEDPLIQTVRTHQHNIPQTKQWYRQLEPQEGIAVRNKTIEGEHSKDDKRKMTGKRRHGQFLPNLDEKLVNKEQSYQLQK